MALRVRKNTLYSITKKIGTVDIWIKKIIFTIFAFQYNF